MKKNLKYYLNLPYKIEIEPILEEEGGGFLARLPQFGTFGITGDGDTIKEAIEMLLSYKEISFKRFLKEKREIPEPEQEKMLDDFSGKILVRTPKELHQSIGINATRNGISQNQYINYLLTKALTKDETGTIEAIEKTIKTTVKGTIKEVLFEITHKQKYNFTCNDKKSLVSEEHFYPEDYKGA